MGGPSVTWEPLGLPSLSGEAHSVQMVPVGHSLTTPPRTSLLLPGGQDVFSQMGPFVGIQTPNPRALSRAGILRSDG